MVLGNLLSQTLLEQGLGWSRWSPVVTLNFSYSVIRGFHFLPCCFQQQNSHMSQSCKTRTRLLATHAHFVQCWPQGTEACQLVESKERHKKTLHRISRKQGKQNSSHCLGGGKTQKAARGAAELWQVGCVLLWDLMPVLQVTLGLSCHLLLLQGSETAKAKVAHRVDLGGLPVRCRVLCYPKSL